MKNSTNYINFRVIEHLSKSKQVEIVTSSSYERNKEKEILQLQQQSSSNRSQSSFRTSHHSVSLNTNDVNDLRFAFDMKLALEKMGSAFVLTCFNHLQFVFDRLSAAFRLFSTNILIFFSSIWHANVATFMQRYMTQRTADSESGRTISQIDGARVIPRWK